MRGPRGAFPAWPLLLLQHTAWAALRVSVPSSPIRALPLSDIRLPCNISDSTKAIDLSELGVTWRRGQQNIAEYPDGSGTVRQGAKMSKERLQVGDASLLLPRVEDTDSGVYMCDVIHTPEEKQGIIELKVEAEPRIELSSTKLRLAELGTVTCTASDFYPGHVTVEWLKDGVAVKGPRPSINQDAHSALYKASNTLELTPVVADANANFSCRVTHKSLKEPLKEDFRLQLQARPHLQVITGVSVKTLEVLDCSVSGFYPQDIRVRWLRNRVPQLPIESQPQAMANGTFSMHSLIRPEEVDPRVQYVCQVQHKALASPLELEARWQPKDEGDGRPCPTPQYPGSSGKPGTPCSCPSTPVPTSQTSALDTTALWSWIVLGLGLALTVIGGVMLYRACKKDKNKPCPAKEGLLNKEKDPEATEDTLKPEKENKPCPASKANEGRNKERDSEATNDMLMPENEHSPGSTTTAM